MLSSQRITFFLLALLVVGLAGSTYAYRQKYQQAVQGPAASSTVQLQTDAQLIADVAKLIALPANETPTVATVADPSKLKDQPFFANAQVGDKVLIYTASHKAVLYRPREHKLIEVAPLDVGAVPTVKNTK